MHACKHASKHCTDAPADALRRRVVQVVLAAPRMRLLNPRIAPQHAYCLHNGLRSDQQRRYERPMRKCGRPWAHEEEGWKEEVLGGEGGEG